MSASVVTKSDTAVAGSTLVVPQPRKGRSLSLWLSMAWLGLVVTVAAIAGLLPLADPGVPVGPPRSAPAGSLEQLLGLDHLGRSVLSRAISGSRVSLIVGAVSAISALLIGTALGLLAGYYRGWVETVIMYLTDSLLAFPPLVLLLALSSVLRPSYTTLLLGLTTVVVPTFTRLARANTLNWSSREFVLAATNMGARSSRIAVREVLPNVLPALLAYLPTVLAALIVAEGSLSFLGLGIPSPTPSWGGMISDARANLHDVPLLVIVPAAFIFFTVFSLNQVGDHVRARFDRPARG